MVTPLHTVMQEKCQRKKNERTDSRRLAKKCLRGCLYSAEAASWGDVSRFGRKEDFASFLGMVPGDYSSGDREHRGHIPKQGN